MPDGGFGPQLGLAGPVERVVIVQKVLSWRLRAERGAQIVQVSSERPAEYRRILHWCSRFNVARETMVTHTPIVRPPIGFIQDA
ncbi:hypothetical protein A5695_15045 [Mycobacterium sp. E1747]|nr:hypothetical protein A5695_15045 [Mycobacterium sp. E1747]